MLKKDLVLLFLFPPDTWGGDIEGPVDAAHLVEGFVIMTREEWRKLPRGSRGTVWGKDWGNNFPLSDVAGATEDMKKKLIPQRG